MELAVNLREKIKSVGALMQATVAIWLRSQSFIFAGALAFFTMFSIAPVVILAVHIIGLVLSTDAAMAQIMMQLEEVLGPDAAEAVAVAVEGSRMSEGSLVGTLIGVGALTFGATTVFAQMQRALNTIWQVVPRPSRNSIMLMVRSRLLSLTVVLAIGFVLLVSMLLSVMIRAVMVFAQDWVPMPPSTVYMIEFGVSVLVVSSLFATIFKVLPDVHLRWRDVWIGAVLTALLFIFGRSLIALYLANTATASAYGAAGSLVMLLLWVNYSSLILLFGASFTRAWAEHRGLTILPKATALRQRMVLLEDL